MAILSAIVSVPSTAILVTVGGSSVGDLRTVIVRNDSGVDIFLGGISVTVSDGLRLPTASTLTLDLGPGDSLYAIASAGPLALQVLTTRV